MSGFSEEETYAMEVQENKRANGEIMDYVEKAQKLGTEHGTNAAEFDLQYSIGGRVPAKDALNNARAIVQLEAKGDLDDAIPYADLSGEYGDGMTPRKLMELVTGSLAYKEWDQEIIQAYENSFADASYATILKAAKEYLENERENSTNH